MAKLRPETAISYYVYINIFTTQILKTHRKSKLGVKFGIQ